MSGVAVAIARDDKLVHYKGYGQLDSTKDTPIPLGAVFALASMTKPMAAVAGLMLLEQGHNRRLANCLSPPFVIFMKRQAPDRLRFTGSNRGLATTEADIR